MKIEEKDINELENTLKQYANIKIKFICNMDKYTEKEREIFWKKFYERKLNVLLSIVYYHYTKKDLSVFTNPFVEIQKEEAGKYREKICIELSKMNINKIASEDTLLKQYEDLKNKIKTKKDDFLYDMEFWKLFMNFYILYHVPRL